MVEKGRRQALGALAGSAQGTPKGSREFRVPEGSHFRDTKQPRGAAHTQSQHASAKIRAGWAAQSHQRQLSVSVDVSLELSISSPQYTRSGSGKPRRHVRQFCRMSSPPAQKRPRPDSPLAAAAAAAPAAPDTPAAAAAREIEVGWDASVSSCFALDLIHT